MSDRIIGVIARGPRGPSGDGASADASATTKGVVKLATAPADAANPIAVGDNDPRNSNARTPTAHQHVLADITDAGTAAAADTADFDPAGAADQVKSDLLGGAPAAALDTLDELSAALNDDPNTVATLTTNIASKLAKASNLSDLVDAAAARTNLGLGSAATHVATDFDSSGAAAAAQAAAEAASDPVGSAAAVASDLTTETSRAEAAEGVLDGRLDANDAVATILDAPSGSDDLAMINAAITAVANLGGGTVRARNLTYKISGPIVVRSKVRLDMTGATINFSSTSVRTNMLQSAAVTPVTTVANASVTAGSSVVTSATLAAAASVGQMCAVVGAGPPGGNGGGACWLYGRVAAVDTGAGTVTLAGNVNGVASHITGSSKTAYLFNRDSDIEVIGGTWDSGSNWNVSTDRSTAGFDSHLLRLRRVDRLNIRNVTVKSDTFTSGLGWAYGINLGDCTEWVAENLRGRNSSTVFQCDGPLARGIVRNVQGTTQDDMLGFFGVSFQGNDVEGDITDIVIENVQGLNSHRAMSLSAGAGANGAKRYCQVTVRSVKGTFQQDVVNVGDYSGAGSGYINVLAEDISATPGAGFQGIKNTATYGYVSRNPSGAFHPSDAGLRLSTLDPGDVNSTFTPGGGFVYLFKVNASEAITVANLLVLVTTAGSGLTSNQCFAGIYDRWGNLVAKTADQSTAWASTGQKTMALTAQSGYTLTLPGGPGVFYWIGLLANGTTKPTFVAQATGTASFTFQPGAFAGAGVSLPGSKVRAGYYATGSNTSLPSLTAANIADSGMTQMVWVGAT